MKMQQLIRGQEVNEGLNFLGAVLNMAVKN